jgi:hypothetical protein
MPPLPELPIASLFIFKLFIVLQTCILKVPKREIFDRSDFPDFYTMKFLRVGDFGVKIKIFLKNI